MDSLLRVALGIGDSDEMLSPKAFGNRLREIAVRQHVYTTLDRFKALAQRTCEAIAQEKEVKSEAAELMPEPSTVAPQEPAPGEEANVSDAVAEEELSLANEDLAFDADTPPSYEVDDFEAAPAPGGEAQENLEDAAAELEASEAVTQKSRLSFFQWVKNKGVFPDNILQLCMDALKPKLKCCRHYGITIKL